jgi:uncharacterized protein
MILAALPTTPGASPFGDALFAFLAIALEGMPFIVLGTLLSGFIDAFMPPRLLERLLPKNPWMAVVMSALLGLLLPVCECAVVPVIRRLVKKGLPVSCAVTYMLAAPVINPITLWSTHMAFINDSQMSWFMPFSRMGLALTVTVLIGWIVNKIPLRKILRPEIGRGLPGYEADEVAAPMGVAETSKTSAQPKGSFDSRILHAIRSAKHDLLDTSMYFIIGALITSLFNTKVYIQPAIQESLAGVAGNNALAVPCMMILAALLSLCSTTDAFIAANLHGFHWVAKLAFLVYGPMVDLKLLFMYSSVFQKRFVGFLVVALFILIGLFCLVWHSSVPSPMPVTL